MSVSTFVVGVITWPVWACIALAGGGAATAGTMWWKHRKRRKAVMNELDSFKEKVVEISETLDALQHHHKMLPFTDADYTVPMTGQTLREYENVQQSLDQYRERWLKLMDIWDKSQKIVEEEGIGKKEKFDAAQETLKNIGLVKELEDIRQACEQPLIRLGNAHEVVKDALAKLDDSSDTLGRHMQTLEQAGVSVEPFQLRLDTAAEFTDQGKTVEASDPLGAMDFLQKAQSIVEDMNASSEIGINNVNRAAELEKGIAGLDQSIESKRREGYLFSEPEASPVPHLQNARDFLQIGREHLTACEIDESTKSLTQAADFADRANEAVSAAEMMRTNGQAELEERRRALEALADEVAQAKLWKAELERNFAPESWLSVADNVDHATELIQHLQRYLTETELALEPNTQHYSRARQILELVDRQAPDVKSTIDAIKKKLDELNTIRNSCEQQHAALQAESGQLGSLLRQHTDDRPLCNHRFELANDRLQTVGNQLSRGLNDWQLIGQHLQYCKDDFEQVRHLLEEDLRKAAEARSEIAEAESEIRRIRSYYQSGISADVTKARLRLNDAQRSLDHQEYERAVETANTAEQIARDAHDAAVRRVEEHQREQKKRRQQERLRQLGGLLEVAGAVAAQVAIDQMQRRGRRRRR